MHGLVTVFGGTGFIGTQVVRALAKRGFRVRVAARHPGKGYRLRMMGDVGQIQVVQANLRNEASIARALEGAEACVNLVGVLYESGPQSFDSAMVRGADMVAQACRKAKVGRLVHMSSLSADADGPSAYGRIKAAGEAAVRKVLPGAVIIRPSLVFGPEDDFFNRFAGLAAISPVMPLIGGETRYQPVYVADVAAAIAKAVDDPAAPGRTYELGGPAVYTMRELLKLTMDVSLRRRPFVPIPFQIASLIGLAGDIQAWAKGGVGLIPRPQITRDQVELLKADVVVSPGAPGLAELGIEPTALETVLPSYLVRYRRGGQFAEA